MIRRGRHLPVLVALAGAGLVLGTPAPAGAGFNSTRKPTGAAYATATLQPVASATGTCATTAATVSWGSTTSRKTGFVIGRSGSSATTTAAATASSTSVTGLTAGTSYTFTVKVAYQNWRSAAVTTATVAC